ncbi:MAG: hypothetical protein M0C28_35560 [Candidatus Moduliflexus flocculans]|nr:hypothetical protein [Candidatus Moduliflexus flocculans]
MRSRGEDSPDIERDLGATRPGSLSRRGFVGRVMDRAGASPGKRRAVAGDEDRGRRRVRS